MTTKLKKYAILIIAAILLSAMVFAGAASAENITIQNADEWMDKVANTTTINTNIVLTGDIDLSGRINPSINSLSSCTFEGNGHTISNFKGATGLISSVIDCCVANLTISNYNVTSSSYSDTGGLVTTGSNLSLVNCVGKNGCVSGDNFVGGLVGSAHIACSFENCVVINCNVSGNRGVGGILGLSLNDCIFENVQNQFGTIISLTCAGGLCGEVWKNASFVNCAVMNCSMSSAMEKGFGFGGIVSGTSYEPELLTSFENCIVTNSSLSAYQDVGGIMGNTNAVFKCINCKVINCILSAVQSVGGLTSNSFKGGVVENCNVVNSMLVSNLSWGEKVGGIAGVVSEVPCIFSSENLVKWSAIRGASKNSVARIIGSDNGVKKEFYENVTLESVWLNDNTAVVEYPKIIIAKSTESIKQGPESSDYFNHGITADSLPPGAKLITDLNGYGVGGQYKAIAYVIESDLTHSKYIEVSTWDELKEAVSSWDDCVNTRTVVVMNNITSTETNVDYSGITVQGKITITPTSNTGTDIKIDANQMGRLFHLLWNVGNLTYTGNGTTNLILSGGCTSYDGGGIYVDQGGNLTLSAGSIITNCTARDGGGVYLSNGTFNMYGGIITGCSADDRGGGILVNNKGEFVMNSGGVINCSANGFGGGVLIDNNGVFTMNDGLIANCSAFTGAGGVGFLDKSKFIMRGGKIVNCSISYQYGEGGGIHCQGTFEMFGGEVRDCYSAYNGGGVYVGNAGVFTLNNGLIDNCSAEAMGGGAFVSVDYGTTSEFVQNGGYITNCSAVYGGGVYIDDGAYTINGGNIEGNHARYAGGGVYLDYCSGIFNVGGTTIITDNTRFDENLDKRTSNNVCQNNFVENPVNYLNLVGTFTGKISISSPIGPNKKFGNIINGATGAENITSDIDGYIASVSGNALVWKTKEYNITYNLDGGTNSPTNPATYNITSETIALSDASKLGYTFENWYKSSVFTAENKSTAIVKESSGDKAFWANYTGNITTVVFHIDDTTENKLNTYGQATNFSVNPIKSGYTFSHWNVSSTGLDLNSSTYVKNGIWNYTGDNGKTLDVYANWSNPIEYTITYYLDGGSAINPEKYNVTTPTITLTAASKLGYAFEGWYNESSKSAEFKNNSIPLGSTGNKEFWADYTGNITTVVFHIDGTTEDKLNTYSQAINFSAIPTKSGYTFSHWNVSSTGEDLNSSTYVMDGIWNYTGDDGKTLDVYANWTKVHLDLYPGWNVVSTPKKLSSAYDTAAELFADVNTTGHAVLTYNAQTKTWEQVIASTKIEPLNAYWIYSNESKALEYEFSTSISSPAVKNVYQGWNAVGLSAEEPLAASVAFGNTNWYTYLEWNVASQKFNTPIVKGGSGIYADTNLVSLWTGGWLFLSEDGTYMGFTA